jgi:hypothetical protein
VQFEAQWDPSSVRSASPAVPDPEVVVQGQQRKFAAAHRRGIVEEAGRATAPGVVGALLQREGLCSSHLTEWHRLPDSGTLGALPTRHSRKPTRSPPGRGELRVEGQGGARGEQAA